VSDLSSFFTYISEVGGFETVWDPVVPEPDGKYFLISDRTHAVRTWKHVPASLGQFGNSRLANRFHKMLYKVTSEQRGLSVYVDANVRILQPLGEVVEAFANSSADIGLYRHYSHHRLKDEVSMCIRRGKVQDAATAASELDHYFQEGFPDDSGVWEGSVIFKRHDSPRLSAAMEEWWELYSRFQTRDQFSLPFVIWKHGLKVYDLDHHSPGREHYFVRLQHSHHGWRNRTARYLQARAPENWFWKQLHSAARSLDSI
jgi:hypothetical protein